MFSLLLLTLFVNSDQVHSATTCIGEDGQPVDMFIVYKIPRVKSSRDPHISDGYGYIYLDSLIPHFRLGRTGIGYEDNAIGRTLNQVYKYKKQKDDLAFALYNDQPPRVKGTFGSYAHAKGVLAFDRYSGFWIKHSVPRYVPKIKFGYGYPKSGHYYGQMMICVSFNSASFNEIAKQLIYDHPKIYDKHLPGVFNLSHPYVRKLFKNKLIRKAPFSRIIKLESLAGTTFYSFAKDNQFKKDLYHDLVAPYLQTDLLTETWQRGTDIGKSCKGDFTVEDVDGIKVEGLLGSRLSLDFLSLNDHSKFAISKHARRPFVCVGDINRQPSQYKRGGGTLCFKHVVIWAQYFSLVKHIKEKCPKRCSKTGLLR